ncbi:MAG: endonuclease/exonuclease/phosphatase family protein [Anaerolineae bacterium]|nr:endonuclease/exonuclease/phosphatase family protein [Phycisphaerae bacterium]
MIHRVAPCIATLIMLAVGCASKPAPTPTVVRFATFNASLNRDTQGQLARDLSTPDNQQARNVAEVIQRVRPDVLLINEFDYEDRSDAPALFQQNYLSVPQNGAQSIEYPYRVYLPVNTGVFSGHDLDNDGKVVTEVGSRGYGNDCFGFGQFPGQYGMLLLSKYPLWPELSMQELLWKDLPAASLPTKSDGSAWYTNEELNVLRLSSKSHLVVSVAFDWKVIYVLASHPTPPAFDGPEDRNGKRNHDEIRLWKDYLDGKLPQRFPGWSFVIMGDLNADPNDGGSVPGAIQQLLDHPKVDGKFVPRSAGGTEASSRDGGNNASHKSQPDEDTADFGDTGNGPGNLRCDYVLPSKDLKVLGGAVFWPPSSDPLHRLVEMKPTAATSDHRLVYIDVQLP